MKIKCYNCGAWDTDGGCKDACESAMAKRDRQRDEMEAEQEFESAAAEGRNPEPWAFKVIESSSDPK